MSNVKITDIEEHEDGSATLQVECDPERSEDVRSGG